MIHYFQNADGYHGVTDKSPKGMKNVVLIGRGPDPGKGIESIREQVYTTNQLDKMTPINAEDVPDDWFYAIGLEERKKKLGLTFLEKIIIVMVMLMILIQWIKIQLNA